MDKIILTKRQAEALENLKREGNLDDAIDVVMFKIQRGKGWINNGLEALDELAYKDILQALYVGYEVEETKEEKPAKKTAKKEEKEDLSSKTVAELKEMAKAKGIEGYTKLKSFFCTKKLSIKDTTW